MESLDSIERKQTLDLEKRPDSATSLTHPSFSKQTKTTNVYPNRGVSVDTLAHTGNLPQTKNASPGFSRKDFNSQPKSLDEFNQSPIPDYGRVYGNTPTHGESIVGPKVIRTYTKSYSSNERPFSGDKPLQMQSSSNTGGARSFLRPPLARNMVSEDDPTAGRQISGDSFVSITPDQTPEGSFARKRSPIGNYF
jgi:hypothetical protein